MGTFHYILAFISGAIFIIGVALLSTDVRNNTDPADGFSGLRLYTDNLTGCQYVGNSNGGITPRMDTTWHQVCVKR